MTLAVSSGGQISHWQIRDKTAESPMPASDPQTTDSNSGVWSRSLSFEGDSVSGPGPICFIWISVQFIIQLKLCLYTNLHILLEEFKISRKSFLSTQ